MKKTGEVAPSH